MDTATSKRSTANFEWKCTKKTHRGGLPTADLQQKPAWSQTRPPNSNKTGHPAQTRDYRTTGKSLEHPPNPTNSNGIEQNSIIPEYEHRNSKTQSHPNPIHRNSKIQSHPNPVHRNSKTQSHPNPIHRNSKIQSHPNPVHRNSKIQSHHPNPVHRNSKIQSHPNLIHRNSKI
jgi:hypothetical protein